MKKLSKLIAGILILALVFSGASSLLPASAAGVAAKPTTSPVYVISDNTVNITAEAYNIHDNNFFMLRDIAAAVDFGVEWDGTNNRIIIDTTKGYTPDGSESATVTKSTTPVNAIPTSSRIFVDGKEVDMEAYNIHDNNFFMLRDIAKAVNFGVEWISDLNIIYILPFCGYVADADKPALYTTDGVQIRRGLDVQIFDSSTNSLMTWSAPDGIITVEIIVYDIKDSDDAWRILLTEKSTGESLGYVSSRDNVKFYSVKGVAPTIYTKDGAKVEIDAWLWLIRDGELTLETVIDIASNVKDKNGVLREWIIYTGNYEGFEIVINDEIYPSDIFYDSYEKAYDYWKANGGNDSTQDQPQQPTTPSKPEGAIIDSGILGYTTKGEPIYVGTHVYVKFGSGMEYKECVAVYAQKDAYDKMGLIQWGVIIYVRRVDGVTDWLNADHDYLWELTPITSSYLA